MAPRQGSENAPRLEVPPLTDDEATDVESQNGNLHVRSDSQSSETDNPLPIPVWMRESAKSFRYKWIPVPIRQGSRSILKWIKGPCPSRQLRIQPFYPKIQEAPVKLLDKFMPKRRHKIFLLILLYFCWFLTWSLMLRHNRAGGHIKGYGKPQNLWCGASFW